MNNIIEQAVLDSMDIKDKYILARYFYSMATSSEDKELEIMDDESYNILHKEVIRLGFLPEYTCRSWSSDPCPVKLLDKYGLKSYASHIILTGKTESMESVLTELDLKRYLMGMSFPVAVSYKEDGFCTIATYHWGKLVNFESRGRDSSADPIPFYNYMPYLPQEIETNLEIVTVVGELLLPIANFAKMKEILNVNNKSIRASIRTAVTHVETAHLLVFKAYAIKSFENVIKTDTYLTLWDFKTVEWKYANDIEEVISLISAMGELDKFHDTKTDGVVIRVANSTRCIAVRIGRWATKRYQSFIIGYKEEHSSVYCSIGLNIFPITLENSTQNYVAAVNPSMISELGLKIGTPVSFKLTSDAIANLDKEMTLMLQKLYKDNEELFMQKVRNDEFEKLSSIGT